MDDRLSLDLVLDGRPAAPSATAATASTSRSTPSTLSARSLAALAAVAGGDPEMAGERLLRYFLGLLGDVREPGALLGLIRSAMTSEHAAAVMRRFLAERVIIPAAAALGADQPGLRGALVASQLTGLAVTRYAVQLPLLTAASVADLARWVAPVLQYYLIGTSFAAGHPGPGQSSRADARGTGG